MPRRRTDHWDREKPMLPTTGGPIIECPGWKDDTPCGVAIRRDREICGLCRGKRARAERAARGDDFPPPLPIPELDSDADVALEAPMPMPPPAPPERPAAAHPSMMAGIRTRPSKLVEPPKMHWSRIERCGNLGKGAPPQKTDDPDKVNCGRCRRIIDQGARVAAPKPSAAAPDEGEAGTLTKSQRRRLREIDDEVEAVRSLGRRNGETRLRVDLSHFETVRGYVRRLAGV